MTTPPVIPGPDLRFGLFLSQARLGWPEVIDGFSMAEELGFDHAWLVDHLVDTDGTPEDGFLEAWTLLAAIAARTSRIRIGVLVSSNTFRHPSILLKQAVTVDHVSGGRLNLGIGTGWHADEHRRFGIDLPDPPERVDRFEEAVELVARLMDEPSVTMHGRHYRLDDARLRPMPIQRPRIPLVIAAHRPRMLRIAARFADQWDTFAAMPGTATDGVDAALGERMARLDEACRAIGRDPAAIRRSTWTTRDALRSPEAYLGFVRGHHRLGFTDFSTVAPAPSDLPVLRQIATELLPELRDGRLLD